MECDWHWKLIKKEKMKLKKEGIYYELWKFWWSICTTRLKK